MKTKKRKEREFNPSLLFTTKKQPNEKEI